MNEPYFYNKRFLGLTTLLFVGITLAFVVWPVPLPQLLTVFGVLALFTLCIVAFCLYLSLLTIEYRLPVISGLLVFAFVLSILDWNDNHTIRVIVPSRMFERPKAAMKSAAEEFERWYESRPNLEAYDEYPVYLVAAQGGGTVRGLSDGGLSSAPSGQLPSVSKSSVRDQLRLWRQRGRRDVRFGLEVGGAGGRDQVGYESRRQHCRPMSVIAEYFRALRQRSGENQKKQQESEEELVEADEKAGKLERIVRRNFGTDLLSPLVAATLFPDFRAAIYPQFHFRFWTVHARSNWHSNGRRPNLTLRKRSSRSQKAFCAIGNRPGLRRHCS